MGLSTEHRIEAAVTARPRLLVVAVRTAMIATYLGLGIIVSAAYDVPVPELWPLPPEYQGHLLFLLSLALIYSIVAVQRRSWLRALVVLIPIAGAIYSLVSFYRLADRWFNASNPGSERRRVGDQRQPQTNG